MNSAWMVRTIWGAGFVHSGIVIANLRLPARLRVRERLEAVPLFLRQILCALALHRDHGWDVRRVVLWICVRVGERIGPGTLSQRIFVCLLGIANGFAGPYYDRAVRQENRILDLLYLGSLVVLVAVFGAAAWNR